MKKTIKELCRRIRSIQKWRKEVYSDPHISMTTWDLEMQRLDTYREILRMLTREKIEERKGIWGENVPLEEGQIIIDFDGKKRIVGKCYRESEMKNDIYKLRGTEERIDHITDYFYRLRDVFSWVKLSEVEYLMELLQYAKDSKKNIFVMGNGGSAALANHFATDLNSPRMGNKFKAVSLSANESLITCIANDTDYGSIFAGQLMNLMNQGDLVIGISASGNSENIVNGLAYAKNNGGISIGLVGFDGGRVKDVVTLCVHVKSEQGEYGIVEDVHNIIMHTVTSYFYGEGK